MRAVSIDVFTFDELSDKAKEKARESHIRRYDMDDYSDVEEALLKVLKLLGFNVKIEWSGFSSQGDGARIIGKWAASDYTAEDAKLVSSDDEEFSAVAVEIEKIATNYSGWTCVIRASPSIYCHELTTIIDLDYGDNTEVKINQYNDWCQLLYRLMKWCYSQLEERNTVIHSNEYIDDVLSNSDDEYTIDGSTYP